MGRPSSKDEQCWIRLPAKVKRAAQKLADADGRSLSNWLARVIEQTVNAQQTGKK